MFVKKQEHFMKIKSFALNSLDLWNNFLKFQPKYRIVIVVHTHKFCLFNTKPKKSLEIKRIHRDVVIFLMNLLTSFHNKSFHRSSFVARTFWWKLFLTTFQESWQQMISVLEMFLLKPYFVLLMNISGEFIKKQLC